MAHCIILLSITAVLSAMLPRHTRGSVYGNSLGSLSRLIFLAELASAIIAFFVAPQWWYGLIALAIVVLNVHGTWQFPDYTKYDTGAVDVKEKQWYRDNQWPKDLQAAYELGKRMIEQAK